MTPRQKKLALAVGLTAIGLAALACIIGCAPGVSGVRQTIRNTAQFASAAAQSLETGNKPIEERLLKTEHPAQSIAAYRKARDQTYLALTELKIALKSAAALADLVEHDHSKQSALDQAMATISVMLAHIQEAMAALGKESVP